MYKTFYEWLHEKGLEETKELRDCWNQALETADEYFGDIEGNTFGMFEKFYVD